MRIALPKNHIVLFILILLVSIPITSYAVDGQRKLTQPIPPATFPIVINQAGSYVLTSNLVVTDPNLNAIEITVNDVTLDLNGHKIQGAESETGYSVGINGTNHYNITIMNGRIWGFSDGIWFSCNDPSPCFNNLGILIDRVQALNNKGRGIMAIGGVIKNCIANNNGSTGIWMHYGTIMNCTTNNNGTEGIYARSSSVINCTTNYNQRGIDAGTNSIVNCVVSFNRGRGIFAQGDVIVNSIIQHNGEEGILASPYTTIHGCSISYNSGWGILFQSGNNCHVYENTIGNNTAGNITCGTDNICRDNAIFP